MYLRQDRMTSQERLRALLNYEKLDRVPIGSTDALEFSARNAGYPIQQNYENPEKSFYSQLMTSKQYGWDNIPMQMSHTILAALDFGGEVKIPYSDYQQGIVTESYPVNGEGDIAKLRMPDPKNAGRIPKAKEFARLQVENGLSPWFYSRSPFTMAANMAGIQQFCRWTLKKPDLCHELIKLALSHCLDVIRDWVATFNAEDLFINMSSPNESNQLISPKQFEKFALPYHIEYHEYLRKMGVKRFYFHICGDQNLNLPYFAEVSLWPHPSILSFGPEVDLEIAAKYFPKDIIFGNIDPAVVQTGSPQDVYELSRIAIKKGKKASGGFVLGTGCVLPKAAPPLNVFAMTRAVNDFGWYE